MEPPVTRGQYRRLPECGGPREHHGDGDHVRHAKRAGSRPKSLISSRMIRYRRMEGFAGKEMPTELSGSLTESRKPVGHVVWL